MAVRFLLGLAAFLCVVLSSAGSQEAARAPHQPQAQTVSSSEALQGEDSRGGVQVACNPKTRTPECRGKAACIQLKLEAAVRDTEAISNGLDHLRRIDAISQQPSSRNALEAELEKLEQSTHAEEASINGDVNATIKRVKASIRAMNKEHEKALIHEARRIGEAARRTARDLQATARHAARQARTHADELARASHGLRSCEAVAERLARRAETAADDVERKGEALSRSADDAARRHLQSHDERLRRRWQGHRRRAAFRGANSTQRSYSYTPVEGGLAATDLLPEPSVGMAQLGTPALMWGTTAAGVAWLVAHLAKRRLHFSTVVNTPSSALG